MDFETLLSSLPVTWVNKDGCTSGLCIRYKISANKWVCSYGVSRGVKNLNKNINYIGVGDTPFDAVSDFIGKIKKWNKVG